MAACAPQKMNQELADQLDVGLGIVGGEAVNEGDVIAKSTVGIVVRGQGLICTGTLISKNLVITAAHCTTDDARMMGIAFVRELPKNQEEASNVVIAPVDAGKTHPAWPSLNENREKNWGDVAILRFKGEVPAGYGPARLLGTTRVLKNGDTATLAGFGNLSMRPLVYADKLMKADVVLSDKSYSQTEVLFEQHDGKGACHGDSGGPAFVKINGREYVFGVTSRSATPMGGRTCLEGSVYSSIPALGRWIQTAARELVNPQFTETKIPQPRGI